MNKKRFKFPILAMGIAMAGIVSFSSCTDDDSVTSGQEFAYKAFALGEEGSTQLVLDQLSGSLKNIECSATWLTANESG